MESEFPATSTDPESSVLSVKTAERALEESKEDENVLKLEGKTAEKKLSDIEPPSELAKAAKPKKGKRGNLGKGKKVKKVKEEPKLEQTDRELTSSLGSIHKIDLESKFKTAQQRGKITQSESSNILEHNLEV